MFRVRFGVLGVGLRFRVLVLKDVPGLVQAPETQLLTQTPYN